MILHLVDNTGEAEHEIDNPDGVHDKEVKWNAATDDKVEATTDDKVDAIAEDRHDDAEDLDKNW